jgi:hypothetical protein
MALMILGPNGALSRDEVTALIGHNNPPADPFEAFDAHLADLRLEAGNWLDGSPIETQAQADEVSRLMGEHRKAAKDADAARKVEKEPHLKAATAVDAKWAPLIDRANLAVTTCKEVLAPWLMKLEADRQAEAEAKRQEAEAATKAAAEAMQRAVTTDLKAREEAETLIATAKASEKAASRLEKARPQAQGGGRATTLRSYYEPVLTDGVTAARHYWTTNQAACEAFFLSLAKDDVRSGKRQIPGFDVIEERRAV